SKVLCQDGHQILEACDGAIALEMLQTLRCDLVITDFVMPKLNGIKFVEQLHTLKPRMPIILITGYLSAMAGAKILNKMGEVLASHLILMCYGQPFAVCSIQLPTQPPNH